MFVEAVACVSLQEEELLAFDGQNGCHQLIQGLLLICALIL